MSSKHALTAAEQIKENFEAIRTDHMHTLEREIQETKAFLDSLSSKPKVRGPRSAVKNSDLSLIGTTGMTKK